MSAGAVVVMRLTMAQLGARAPAQRGDRGTQLIATALSDLDDSVPVDGQR